MALSETLLNLPEILQNQLVNREFDYTFDSDIDEYTFKKAPIRDTIEVTDVDKTYVEGTDYQLVENSRSPVTIDGQEIRLYDAIDWSVGGDSPDDGDTFSVRQRYETLLSRYLRSHDEEVAGLEDDIVTTIESHQIDKAIGGDLDRIGAIFGKLGERSGRSDADYRAFLKSIVNSFSGRGSRQGLKFAIAAAVGTTTDNIDIIENKEELSYTIRINNVDTSFISDAIDELAELADPSAVELDKSVIVTEGNTIEIVGGSTNVSTEVGLGGSTLTLDGNSTLG